MYCSHQELENALTLIAELGELEPLSEEQKNALTLLEDDLNDARLEILHQRTISTDDGKTSLRTLRDSLKKSKPRTPGEVQLYLETSLLYRKEAENQLNLHSNILPDTTSYSDFWEKLNRHLEGILKPEELEVHTNENLLEEESSQQEVTEPPSVQTDLLNQVTKETPIDA